MIWTLIVGAVIGAIGGSLSGRGKQMGCLFNIIAGLAGSYIGQAIFGLGSSFSRNGVSSFYSRSCRSCSSRFFLHWKMMIMN